MKYIISLALTVAVCVLLLASLPVKQGLAEKESERATVHRLLHEADSLGREWQFDSAFVAASQAAEQASRWLGETDTTYVSALTLLGIYVRGQGDFVKSESLLTKVVILSERIFGAEHPEVAKALTDLAYVYHREDRFAKAEEAYRRALDIQIKTFGPESHEAGKTLLNLVNTLRRQKRFDEIDSVLLRVLNIYEKVFGPQHCQVASVLTTLGTQYRILSRFTEAEKSLLRALSILDVHPEPGKTRMIRALTQLGKLYVIQARYQDAEPYLKRAHKIQGGLDIRRQPNVGPELLNELGNLYKAQGKLTKAEEAYKKSLQLRERILELRGGLDPHIAEPLNNLGELYLQLGRCAEAERCFQRALKARVEYFGPDNDILIYSLNGLGRVYMEYGEYSKADSMFRWALRNVERAYGGEHLHVAWCLDALGDLNRIQGEYLEAESLYAAALEIREGCLGRLHPGIAASLKNLAILYSAMGDFDRSVVNYEGMQQLRYDFIQNVFSYASEGQKMRYVSTYPLVDHSFLSLAISHSTPDAFSSALKTVLEGKAIVIDAVMAEKEAACCSFDDEFVEIHEEHTEVCNIIANMALADATYFPEGTYADSLQTLHDVKDSLETELSRRCSEFRDELASRRFAVSDVADALPEEAVLWEFFRYEPYDFTKIGSDKGKTGPARYLAFALTHSGEVTLVDLGDANEIDSLVGLARKTIYDASARVYSSIVVELEQELSAVTGRLYDVIFAPLEPTLAGRNDIFISPDGQLSLLPFEILPRPDGRYVIESFSISYLSSGRDLLRYKKESERSNQALVIADPDFDLWGKTLSKHVEEIVKQSDVVFDAWEPSRGASDCLNTRFSPLRYSRQESEAVTKTLSKKGNLNVNACYGGDAIEEVLKGITSPPRVLHLATHGYFCEDIDTSESRLLENPLLRSGLALAGANRLIGQTETDGPPTEDGILTAFEVSSLNLVGTELVVLSACETGVGDVKNGEGVFGLRRAFQHAGARTVLMSLWKVPGKETYELMDHFYNAWLDGQSKKIALHKSVLRIIGVLREKYDVAHPYFWGAFVLIGDPGKKS